MTGNCIKCQHCGHNYTRHFAAEIFDRSEDERLCSRLFIATPGGDTDMPTGGRFRFNFDANFDASSDESPGNPSPRRHGIVIEVMCEECQGISALLVWQHKGETMLSLARGPERNKPET